MENKQDQNGLDSAAPKVEEQNHPSPGSGGGFFEIHVKGYLNSQWSDWFEGLEMKYLDNGETILLGPIADQAALMGVLNKLSRLNLALLSVNPVKRITNRRKNEQHTGIKP